MIKIRLASVAVLPAFILLSGCSTMSSTDKGVLGGGAIGAGTGAVVGNALGNTGAGALIGGAVGAISGGLVGNEIEKSEQRTQAQIAAAQAQSQIGVADVIQMAHNHINDGVIIQHIRTSGSVFHLSGQDVLTLKRNGVSDAVVQEMMATANRVPRRVYSSAPVYGPMYQPMYVMEPPPPVAVGVGFGYTRFGGGRCCR